MDEHDHGDEDRRPIFAGSLDLFAFVADNGKSFEGLVPQLVSEHQRWREEEQPRAIAKLKERVKSE